VTVTEWEREALVPVTPRWIVLADVKLHDSVALPEPVTLAGLVAHAVLFVAKPTMPAKPFSAEMVTVDVPAVPAFTMTVVGVRLIVKSWIVNVTIAECDKPPLVPVVAMWMVEAEGNVHDRAELPEPVMAVGDAVHDVLLVARLTVPAKPFSPDIATVEVNVDPT
jgi:hypothetical protein